MLNITGKDVRKDIMGDGHFAAKRGNRLHNGVDKLCNPGQDIRSPIDGTVNRKMIVYGDDHRWKGVELVNDNLIVQIFYVEIMENLIGNSIRKGQLIGRAQNISAKYGNSMKAHVHIQAYINPSLLEML